MFLGSTQSKRVAGYSVSDDDVTESCEDKGVHAIPKSWTYPKRFVSVAFAVENHAGGTDLFVLTGRKHTQLAVKQERLQSL